MKLWHIQIHGTSFCRCPYDAAMHRAVLDSPERIVLVCQHESRESAERNVAILHELGHMGAAVVEGPCMQRSDYE